MSSVKGVKGVNAEFGRLVGRISRETTEEALTEAMIIGEQYATALTPVDTSNLINSRYRKITPTANGFVGQVGYTAAYAGYVHDGGPKNWQKSGAEHEFLRKGFERDGLDDIQRALRTRYERG